jgi:hypothetical protein
MGIFSGISDKLRTRTKTGGALSCLLTIVGLS